MGKKSHMGRVDVDTALADGQRAAELCKLIPQDLQPQGFPHFKTLSFGQKTVRFT